MITDYEKLTFTSSFMFCNILQKDPELCKDLVEVILGVKIREILRTNDEESIKTSNNGHGIRLDVYLEGDDAIYDIEMQTADTGNLQKRSRYYQSVLDTAFLKAGQNYNKLKKTYVIFICTFDLFNRGLAKYTFRNVCDEVSGLQLGDEAIKVFLNAHGSPKEPNSILREFLDYLTTETVSGSLSRRIDNGLRDARKNEEMRLKYMTFEWELASKYEQGLAEGKAEGLAEGKAEIISQLLMNAAPEQLLALGISREDLETVQQGQQAK